MKRKITLSFPLLFFAILMFSRIGISQVRAEEEFTYTDSNGVEYIYWSTGILTAADGASGDIDLTGVANDAKSHGITLTGIKEMAFMEQYITSVNLPASIKIIGQCAFFGCSYLEEVTYEEGSELSTIADGAFRGDGVLSDFHQKGTEALGIFDFPEGLKTIGDDALSGTLPGEIRIPASLTSFGGYAASYCSMLKTVSFAPRTTSKRLSIGEGAFMDSTLNSISIPEGVTMIDEAAFLRCEDLSKVDLPDSLVSIGGRAFESTNLSAVVIPANCTTIGEGTFSKNTVLYGVAGSSAQTYAGKNGLTFQVIETSDEGDGGNEDEDYQDNTETETDRAKDEELSSTDEQPGNNAGNENPQSDNGEPDAHEQQSVDVGTEEKKQEAESDRQSTSGEVTGTQPNTIVNVIVNTESQNNQTRTVMTQDQAAAKASAEVSNHTSSAQNAAMQQEAAPVVYEKAGSKFTIDGLVYKVTGNGTVSFVKPKSKNIKKLVIPDTIQIKGVEYRVTEVAAKACYKLKKLKTVTVGKYVTTVRKQAFQDCRKLKYVTLGRYLKTLGAKCFWGDNKLRKIKMDTCIDFKKAGKKCIPEKKKRYAKFRIVPPTGYEKDYRKIFGFKTK